MIIISIGSTCHQTMALRHYNLYKEAYPFDHIRSKFEGIKVRL